LRQSLPEIVFVSKGAMLSIDAWSIVVTAFQMFTMAYVCGLGAFMILGQFPQHFRSQIPFVGQHLPIFKLSIRKPICIVLYLGGCLLVITEFVLLGTTIFPEYMSNEAVCNRASRAQAVLVLSDYFALIGLMFLRCKASRPPNARVPVFERFVFTALMILAPGAIGISMFFSEGKLFTQVYEGGQTRTMCLMTLNSVPFLVVFSLCDIVISLSLLRIFYNRIHQLDSDDLDREQREDYKHIANLNLRCSIVILSCTVLITQTLVSLDELWITYGQLISIMNIPISILFCVLVTAVLTIFESQFVWPKTFLANSDEEIGMLS
jgi:hypothetical protein